VNFREEVAHPSVMLWESTWPVPTMSKDTSEKKKGSH